MRKYLYILAVLSFQLMFSQTYMEREVSEELVVQGENLVPMTLANLGIEFFPNPRINQIKGNSIFLEQIGDYNVADVKVVSERSEINVFQNGNNNYTSLDYKVKTAFADLSQNGDFNTIKDYAVDPTLDVSLELVQEGNNLNFEREGVNELTKSLKFRQSEASPNLIIRSFPEQ